MTRHKIVIFEVLLPTNSVYVFPRRSKKDPSVMGTKINKTAAFVFYFQKRPIP